MRPASGVADDIGDPRHIGHDDRRAAGHAFQQDIGPAFVARDEQQEVGRAVDFGQAILRHAAEQPDAVGDAALARQPFDGRRAPGPRRR